MNLLPNKNPHPLSSPWRRSSNQLQGKGNSCSWLKTFCKGFGLLITYEIIEELIEEAIAYTITTIIAKAVSFLLVVVLTQTVKVTAKGLAKGITIALKPAVKKLTYREGNDKITKIMRFINMCKEKIKENKFLNFLKRNPKSILGIISGFIASLASGAGTTCGLIVGKVELPLWANICFGVLVWVVLFIFNIIGVKSAGFEGVAKYQVRKLAEKLGFGKAAEELDKVEQAIEAEDKEKAEQEKLALEQAKAKYQEAWRIDITSKKIDIHVSLEDYIAQKQAEEKEAEEKAKQEKIDAEAEQEKLAIENAFLAAVSNGYAGSFDTWKAEQEAATK